MCAAKSVLSVQERLAIGQSVVLHSIGGKEATAVFEKIAEAHERAKLSRAFNQLMPLLKWLDPVLLETATKVMNDWNTRIEEVTPAEVKVLGRTLGEASIAWHRDVMREASALVEAYKNAQEEAAVEREYEEVEHYNQQMPHAAAILDYATRQEKALTRFVEYYFA